MPGSIPVSGRNKFRLNSPPETPAEDLPFFSGKNSNKTGLFSFSWYSNKSHSLLTLLTFNELEDGNVMFKRIWTADMIESHIYSTHSNKEPLNSHYYATHYPSVYAAAERIFGSWGEAITACGFDYSDIRKYKVWNRSKVTETIREMAATGQQLSSQKAQTNHKSLYMAAIRYYKSWGKAVMAAGIDYSVIRERRSMSILEIKTEIIKLHKAGVDLSYCNMRKNYQYLLAYGMKKLGEGSWDAARKVCGIKTNYRIPPNKRKIKRVPLVPVEA